MQTLDNDHVETPLAKSYGHSQRTLQYDLIAVLSKFAKFLADKNQIQVE